MLHEINNINSATELEKIENAATTPEAIETNAAQEATTEANAEPIEEEVPEEIEEEDEDDGYKPEEAERVKDAFEEEDEQTAQDVLRLAKMLYEEEGIEIDDLDDDQIVGCLALLRSDYSADNIEKYAIRYGDLYYYDRCEGFTEIAEQMADEMGIEEEFKKAAGESWFSRYVTIDYEQMGRDMSFEYSYEIVSYKDFNGYVLWIGY